MKKRILGIILVSLSICTLLILTCFADGYDQIGTIVEDTSGWYELYSGPELKQGMLDANSGTVVYNYYKDGSIDVFQSRQYVLSSMLVTSSSYPKIDYGKRFVSSYVNAEDHNYVSIQLNCTLVKNVANYVDKIAIGFNFFTAYNGNMSFVANFTGTDGNKYVCYLGSANQDDTYSTVVNGELYYSLKKDVYFSIDFSTKYSTFDGITIRTSTLSGEDSDITSPSGTRNDTVSIIDVLYQPTIGYNPNLEELVTTINGAAGQISDAVGDAADQISGAIDSGVADLIDIPGVEFVEPEAGQREEQFLGDVKAEFDSFSDSVDFNALMQGTSITDFFDPALIQYVVAYILDPLFDLTLFGVIIKLVVPMGLLLIILNFAGSAASMSRGRTSRSSRGG